MPKAIVACVYSLEVLQTCMSTVDSFRDFGTGWGNMAELDNVGLLWFSVWLGSAALNDIIISTCMIYYLHRSNTGFRHTSALLAKFIRLTIETGAICATFAILDLAFYVAFQNNNYHLAPSIPLSKLYSNSLLVVLNARVRIVGGRDNNDADSASLSYFNAVFPESNGRHQSRTQPLRKAHIRSGGISVAITHETQSDHLHVPMGECEEQSDIQKFDGSPLDIPPEELDIINKNAQLV
ncbi:hypothetical protein PHLCEN_2v2598 [Hermanssonia centrifuga]|uniref:DUF6534 domain-containing protein n=1 Tax=Hermanssonia centrifuga TaxID=98765 RepID=A0A2R6RLG3_9APHY|nr:hypothetical protein PHLCEN_2v2598 [Hermanssonia centrifuga]